MLERDIVETGLCSLVVTLTLILQLLLVVRRSLLYLEHMLAGDKNVFTL